MYQALEPPEHRWQEADELWTQHYGQKTAPLVEGGRDVLSALTGSGYWLRIVTRGSRTRVARKLKVLEIEDLFGAIVLNEDFVHKKPHPEGLRLALRHRDKKAESCCYVGDSLRIWKREKGSGRRP